MPRLRAMIMRCLLPAAAAFALAAAAPAGAGAGAGRSAAGPTLLGTLPLLPPAADSGKPAINPPIELAPGAPGDCLPPLPCGTRLFGAIRKDGAVELRVPALRW